MNQILYEGWIFFPNHRVDMQAGVGLHMSQARQNLGTLGGFKTPLRSKKVFLGPKKKVSQLQNFKWRGFFSSSQEGLISNIWGPYEPSPAKFGSARGRKRPPK